VSLQAGGGLFPSSAMKTLPVAGPGLAAGRGPDGWGSKSPINVPAGFCGQPALTRVVARNPPPGKKLPLDGPNPLGILLPCKWAPSRGTEWALVSVFSGCRPWLGVCVFTARPPSFHRGAGRAPEPASSATRPVAIQRSWGRNQAGPRNPTGRFARWFRGWVAFFLSRLPQPFARAGPMWPVGSCLLSEMNPEATGTIILPADDERPRCSPSYYTPGEEGPPKVFPRFYSRKPAQAARRGVPPTGSGPLGGENQGPGGP